MISLTVIGVASNVIPVFTVIIAYFWLGESLFVFEIVAMVLAIAAVIFIIIDGDRETNHKVGDYEIVCYVLLLI